MYKTLQKQDCSCDQSGQTPHVPPKQSSLVNEIKLSLQVGPGQEYQVVI